MRPHLVHNSSSFPFLSFVSRLIGGGGCRLVRARSFPGRGSQSFRAPCFRWQLGGVWQVDHRLRRAPPRSEMWGARTKGSHWGGPGGKDEQLEGGKITRVVVVAVRYFGIHPVAAPLSVLVATQPLASGSGVAGTNHDFCWYRGVSGTNSCWYRSRPNHTPDGNDFRPRAPALRGLVFTGFPPRPLN